MGYMVAQKGGYDRVGFTKKDLYNYFDKKMRATIKDSDVAAALNYLHAKSSTDPMLYAKYVVSSDGRMKSLFWAYGSSRSDFLFWRCGYIRHDLIEEQIQLPIIGYIFRCMEDKYPEAIVTDRDGAMRGAIKQVFPDATHRLCACNLNKNAGENVKNSRFLQGFQKSMYSNFTKDEFEEFWSELIKENELEENLWVEKTYKNKSLWATTYLSDKFFGRIRTTSQCEAINTIIKSYALRSYRNNELTADFKSKFTEPMMTTHLGLLERHAAKIYTTEIFKEVKDEITKAGSLIVKAKFGCSGVKTYKLNKYFRDNYEIEVVYDGDTLQCECKLWESRGIPCSQTVVPVWTGKVRIPPSIYALECTVTDPPTRMFVRFMK
ncbi:protein FAR1-RELATED SEQUENCE 5-like [Vicia villosa]|uniref:protein FAR1-RELATED SEQUENCE 5-like n=1 Tax=Vicia villosa TaxID=3911 RepID=UPI00273B74BC|nr:protein FAR1-RELATED SEQUENCE 5-like [Vicia villosa]